MESEQIRPKRGNSHLIEVRAAVREDLSAILAIYNDAVLTTTATYDYEPRTLEQRILWFEDHQGSGLPVYVAVTDRGVVAGWSALNRYHDRPGFRFTAENSVYVHADYRGQGIAGKLLTPLLQRAGDLGLRAVIAGIDAENEASLRLHARHGFVQVGRFPNVGYKFGRWLDVVYMQYTLPESGVRF
jgi:phosphinothricin acetyltransferase